MDNLDLHVKSRTAKGNGPARALRREDKIPAVVYGPRSASRMLDIEIHQLEVIKKKGGLGRSVYNLFIDDEKTPTPVMIKELQTHPVSGAYLHVDFYEVVMDRKIGIMVPVHTTGKSIGVENGGMLQLIRRELEVLCYPNQIPETIVIDISELDIGDSIHVEDVSVEGGSELPHDVNFTVLTISATKQDSLEEEGEEGEESAEGEAEAAADTEGE